MSITVARDFFTREQRSIRVGTISIDRTTQKVEYKGRRVPLTPKEYALLEMLASNKEQTVTKRNLDNRLYFDEPPNASSLEVFVSRLRKTLKKCPESGVFIETVYGIGYMLHEQLRST